MMNLLINEQHGIQNTDRIRLIFERAFPALTLEEQILALSLYLLLTEARPVTLTKLASHANLPREYVSTTLSNWPQVEYDSNHLITGFFGLTIKTTLHEFIVNDSAVFTWCAWDSLFIPELLNTTASVNSRCAITGESIRLIVSPKKIESIYPETTVITLLIPTETELTENVTCNFCQYVNFFHSADAGNKWILQHPGSFLLSVNDAYHLGKKVNHTRYPDIMTNY